MDDDEAATLEPLLLSAVKLAAADSVEEEDEE